MRKIFNKYRSLKLSFYCLAIVLAPLSVVAAEQPAKTKTFVVVGSATVSGSNVSAARETAISDTLVAAVARMTEELLQTGSLVNNFSQVNGLLFDQTSKFVQDYKVLTEVAHGRSYRVVVQATVSGHKIAQTLSDAGILGAQTNLPGVLLLVAEQNLEEPRPRFWWNPREENFVSVSETLMAERLKEAGFTVIDHRVVMNQLQINWSAFNDPELTNEAAAELGSLFNADVIVAGTATANPSTNIMGSAMRSFNGTVAGRVIRAQSAEPMLNFSRTAVAVNEDYMTGSKEALAEAGELAGGALAEELAAAWQKQAVRPSVVEMVIRGTGQLANYVKFRRTLNTISGVEGIRVKEIKPNEAVLLVEYKGKTKSLAEALMLQNFESFGINIFEVTSNAVKVELIPG
jgi:hypothetical protein